VEAHCNRGWGNDLVCSYVLYRCNRRERCRDQPLEKIRVRCPVQPLSADSKILTVLLRALIISRQHASTMILEAFAVATWEETCLAFAERAAILAIAALERWNSSLIVHMARAVIGIRCPSVTYGTQALVSPPRTGQYREASGYADRQLERQAECHHWMACLAYFRLRGTAWRGRHPAALWRRAHARACVDDRRAACDYSQPYCQRCCQKKETRGAFGNSGIQRRVRSYSNSGVITDMAAPTLRALALFGRRPQQHVVRSSSPAAENLRTSGLMQCSKRCNYSITSSAGTTALHLFRLHSQPDILHPTCRSPSGEGVVSAVGR
jgi:hypothetical protein